MLEENTRVSPFSPDLTGQDLSQAQKNAIKKWEAEIEKAKLITKNKAISQLDAKEALLRIAQENFKSRQLSTPLKK